MRPLWLAQLFINFITLLCLWNHLTRQIFLIIKLDIFIIHVSSGTIYYTRLWDPTILCINGLIQFIEIVKRILNILDIILIRIWKMRNILPWKLSVALVVLGSLWVWLINMLAINKVIYHRIILIHIMIFNRFLHHIFLIWIIVFIYITLRLKSVFSLP